MSVLAYQEVTRRIEELTRCVYELDPFYEGEEDPAATLAVLVSSGARARAARRPRSPLRRAPAPPNAWLQPGATYAEIVKGQSSRSSSLHSRQPSAHRTHRMPSPEPHPPGASPPRSDSVVRQSSPVPSDGVDYSETVQCHVSESVMYSGDDDRYDTVLETPNYIETPEIEIVDVVPQNYQQPTQIEKEAESVRTPTIVELEPPVDRARSISPGGKYRSQDLSYAEILALGLRKQATTQSITSLPKPQVAQVEMVKEVIIEVEKAPQAPVEYKVPSRESSKYRSERRERPSQRSRSRDMPRQRRAPEKRPTKSHDVQTLKKKKMSRKVIEVQEFEETPETVNPEPIVSERIPQIHHKIIENVKSEEIVKSDTNTNISETTNKSDYEDSEIAVETTHKKHKKKPKPKKSKDSEDEIEKALKEIENSSKQRKKKTKNIHEVPTDTVDITVTKVDPPEKKKPSKQIKSEVMKAEDIDRDTEKEIFKTQAKLDNKCQIMKEKSISQSLIESESKKYVETTTEYKAEPTLNPLEPEELKTKKKKKSKKSKSTIENDIKDESSQISKSDDKLVEKIELLDKDPKIIVKDAVKESVITMDWNALMEEEENIPESSLSVDTEKLHTLKEIHEQVATEVDILPEKESQVQDTKEIDNKEIILELYESSIVSDVETTPQMTEEKDFHVGKIQDTKSDKNIEIFAVSDPLLKTNLIENEPQSIDENITPKEEKKEKIELWSSSLTKEQNVTTRPEETISVVETTNINVETISKNIKESKLEMVQNINEEEFIPVNIEGEQNNNDKFFSTEPLKEIADVVQEVTTYEPQEVDTHTIYLITHEEKKLPPIRTLKVYSKDVSNDKIQTPDNEINIKIEQKEEEQQTSVIKDVIKETIDQKENIEMSIKSVADQSQTIENENLQVDDTFLDKSPEMETENITEVYDSEEVLEQAIFGSVQERKKHQPEKIITIPYKELVDEVKTYSVDLDYEQLDYNYYELKKKELDSLQNKNEISNIVENIQPKEADTILDQTKISENYSQTTDLVEKKSEKKTNLTETNIVDDNVCSSAILNKQEHIVLESPNYSYQENADSEKLLGVINSSKKEQVKQIPLESTMETDETHLIDDKKIKSNKKSDKHPETSCKINDDEDINIKHLIEDIPRQSYHDIKDSEKLYALTLVKSLKDFEISKNDDIVIDKTGDLIYTSSELIQGDQGSQAETPNDKFTTEKIIKDYILDSNASYNYQDIKRGEELLAIKSSRENSVEPLELKNQADLLDADNQVIDVDSAINSNENVLNKEKSVGVKDDERTKTIMYEVPRFMYCDLNDAEKLLASCSTVIEKTILTDGHIPSADKSDNKAVIGENIPSADKTDDKTVIAENIPLADKPDDKTVIVENIPSADKPDEKAVKDKIDDKKVIVDNIPSADKPDDKTVIVENIPSADKPDDKAVIGENIPLADEIDENTVIVENITSADKPDDKTVIVENIPSVGKTDDKTVMVKIVPSADKPDDKTVIGENVSTTVKVDDKMVMGENIPSADKPDDKTEKSNEKLTLKNIEVHDDRDNNSKTIHIKENTDISHKRTIVDDVPRFNYYEIKDAESKLASISTPKTTQSDIPEGTLDSVDEPQSKDIQLNENVVSIVSTLEENKTFEKESIREECDKTYEAEHNEEEKNNFEDSRITDSPLELSLDTASQIDVKQDTLDNLRDMSTMNEAEGSNGSLVNMVFGKLDTIKVSTTLPQTYDNSFVEDVKPDTVMSEVDNGEFIIVDLVTSVDNSNNELKDTDTNSVENQEFEHLDVLETSSIELVENAIKLIDDTIEDVTIIPAQQNLNEDVTEPGQNSQFDECTNIKEDEKSTNVLSTETYTTTVESQVPEDNKITLDIEEDFEIITTQSEDFDTEKEFSEPIPISADIKDHSVKSIKPDQSKSTDTHETIRRDEISTVCSNIENIDVVDSKTKTDATRHEKSPIHSLHDLLPEIDSIPEFKPSYPNTFFSNLSADAPEFTPSYMYQAVQKETQPIPTMHTDNIPLTNKNDSIPKFSHNTEENKTPSYSSILGHKKKKVETQIVTKEQIVKEKDSASSMPKYDKNTKPITQEKIEEKRKVERKETPPLVENIPKLTEETLTSTTNIQENIWIKMMDDNKSYAEVVAEGLLPIEKHEDQPVIYESIKPESGHEVESTNLRENTAESPDIEPANSWAKIVATNCPVPDPALKTEMFESEHNIHHKAPIILVDETESDHKTQKEIDSEGFITVERSRRSRSRSREVRSTSVSKAHQTTARDKSENRFDALIDSLKNDEEESVRSVPSEEEKESTPKVRKGRSSKSKEKAPLHKVEKNEDKEIKKKKERITKPTETIQTDHVTPIQSEDVESKKKPKKKKKNKKGATEVHETIEKDVTTMDNTTETLKEPVNIIDIHKSPLSTPESIQTPVKDRFYSDAQYWKMDANIIDDVSNLTETITVDLSSDQEIKIQTSSDSVEENILTETQPIVVVQTDNITTKNDVQPEANYQDIKKDEQKIISEEFNEPPKKTYQDLKTIDKMSEEQSLECKMADLQREIEEMLLPENDCSVISDITPKELADTNESLDEQDEITENITPSLASPEPEDFQHQAENSRKKSIEGDTLQKEKSPQLLNVQLPSKEETPITNTFKSLQKQDSNEGILTKKTDLYIETSNSVHETTNRDSLTNTIANLKLDNFWLEKCHVDDAEKRIIQNNSKVGIEEINIAPEIETVPQIESIKLDDNSELISFEQNLYNERSFWTDKHIYHDAECNYFVQKQNKIKTPDTVIETDVNDKKDKDRDPGSGSGHSSDAEDKDRHGSCGSPFDSNYISMDLPGGICSWKDQTSYLSTETPTDSLLGVGSEDVSQIGIDTTEDVLTTPTLEPDAQPEPLQELPAEEETRMTTKDELSNDIETLLEEVKIVQANLSDLPNESLDAMEQGLKEGISILVKCQEAADILEQKVMEFRQEAEVQTLLKDLIVMKARIAKLLVQARQGLVTIQDAKKELERQNEEVEEQKQKISKLDTWLETINNELKESTQQSEILTEETILRYIEIYERYIREYEEYEIILKSICIIIRDDSSQMKEKLNITKNTLEKTRNLVINEIERLRDILMHIRSVHDVIEEDISQTDRTIDSTSMPEEVVSPRETDVESKLDKQPLTEEPFVQESHITQVETEFKEPTPSKIKETETIETQTGQSLMSDKPSVTDKSVICQPDPISTHDVSITCEPPKDIEVQTSEPKSEEKEMLENIQIRKTISEGHETIEIASKPVYREYTTNEQSLVVGADYKDSDLHKDTNLNITHSLPQSFETVMVEPDETTTEVVVDADGTKRIIVKKVRKTLVTRQQIIHNKEQRSQILSSDGVPQEQTFSQITMRGDKGSTITTLDDGGVQTIKYQTYGGEIVSGLPSGEVTIQEFTSKPDMVISLEQGFKPDDILQIAEGEIKPHIQTSSSSVTAVVQQVTKRIVKTRRRIIRKVVIIDGKEHVTEEIIDEPDNVEITEEEIPRVSISVKDGSYVQVEEPDDKGDDDIEKPSDSRDKQLPRESPQRDQDDQEQSKPVITEPSEENDDEKQQPIDEKSELENLVKEFIQKESMSDSPKANIETTSRETIQMFEEKPTVQSDNNQLATEQIHQISGYSDSTMQLSSVNMSTVVQKVTRKITRTRKRIIKHIKIIDGKEHVTEEVIEEPDDVEIIEEEPKISHSLQEQGVKTKRIRIVRHVQIIDGKEHVSEQVIEDSGDEYEPTSTVTTEINAHLIPSEIPQEHEYLQGDVENTGIVTLPLEEPIYDNRTKTIDSSKTLIESEMHGSLQDANKVPANLEASDALITRDIEQKIKAPTGIVVETSPDTHIIDITKRLLGSESDHTALSKGASPTGERKPLIKSANDNEVSRETNEEIPLKSVEPNIIEAVDFTETPDVIEKSKDIVEVITKGIQKVENNLTTLESKAEPGVIELQAAGANVDNLPIVKDNKPKEKDQIVDIKKAKDEITKVEEIVSTKQPKDDFKNVEEKICVAKPEKVDKKPKKQDKDTEKLKHESIKSEKNVDIEQPKGEFKETETIEDIKKIDDLSKKSGKKVGVKKQDENKETIPAPLQTKSNEDDLKVTKKDLEIYEKPKEENISPKLDTEWKHKVTEEYTMQKEPTNVVELYDNQPTAEIIEQEQPQIVMKRKIVIKRVQIIDGKEYVTEEVIEKPEDQLTLENNPSVVHVLQKEGLKTKRIRIIRHVEIIDGKEHVTEKVIEDDGDEYIPDSTITTQIDVSMSKPTDAEKDMAKSITTQEVTTSASEEIPNVVELGHQNIIDMTRSLIESESVIPKLSVQDIKAPEETSIQTASIEAAATLKDDKINVNNEKLPAVESQEDQTLPELVQIDKIIEKTEEEKLSSSDVDGKAKDLNDEPQQNRLIQMDVNQQFITEESNNQLREGKNNLKQDDLLPETLDIISPIHDKPTKSDDIVTEKEIDKPLTISTDKSVENVPTKLTEVVDTKTSKLDSTSADKIQQQPSQLIEAVVEETMTLKRDENIMDDANKKDYITLQTDRDTSPVSSSTEIQKIKLETLPSPMPIDVETPKVENIVSETDLNQKPESPRVSYIAQFEENYEKDSPEAQLLTTSVASSPMPKDIVQNVSMFIDAERQNVHVDIPQPDISVEKLTQTDKILAEPTKSTENIDISMSITKSKISTDTDPKMELNVSFDKTKSGETHVVKKDIQVDLPSEVKITKDVPVSTKDVAGVNKQEPIKEEGDKEDKKRRRRRKHKRPTSESESLDTETHTETDKSIIDTESSSLSHYVELPASTPIDSPKPTHDLIESQIGDTQVEPESSLESQTKKSVDEIGYEPEDTHTSLDANVAADSKKKQKKRKSHRTSEETLYPKQTSTEDETTVTSPVEVIEPIIEKKVKGKKGKKRLPESVVAAESPVTQESPLTGQEITTISPKEESYHTISETSDISTVKIVEECVGLSPESVKEDITTTVTYPVPVFEEVPTQEYSVQTSPRDEPKLETIQKPEMADTVLQTSPTPVSEVIVQTTPTEDKEVDTQTNESMAQNVDFSDIHVQTSRTETPELKIQLEATTQVIPRDISVPDEKSSQTSPIEPNVESSKKETDTREIQTSPTPQVQSDEKSTEIKIETIDSTIQTVKQDIVDQETSTTPVEKVELSDISIQTPEVPMISAFTQSELTQQLDIVLPVSKEEKSTISDQIDVKNTSQQTSPRTENEPVMEISKNEVVTVDAVQQTTPREEKTLSSPIPPLELEKTESLITVEIGQQTTPRVTEPITETTRGGDKRVVTIDSTQQTSPRVYSEDSISTSTDEPYEVHLRAQISIPQATNDFLDSERETAEHSLTILGDKHKQRKRKPKRKAESPLKSPESLSDPINAELALSVTPTSDDLSSKDSYSTDEGIAQIRPSTVPASQESLVAQSRPTYSDVVQRSKSKSPSPSKTLHEPKSEKARLLESLEKRTQATYEPQKNSQDSMSVALIEASVEKSYDHVVNSKLEEVKNAIENKDPNKVEKNVIVIIETISIWLEEIQYKIHGAISSGSKVIDEAQRVKDLEQHVQHLKEIIYVTEVHEEIVTLIETLTRQMNAVSHLSNESMTKVKQSEEEWLKFLEDVELLTQSVGRMKTKLEELIVLEMPTTQKLDGLDQMETDNVDNLNNVRKMFKTYRTLLETHPKIECPSELYRCDEDTKHIENTINIERDRLLQLTSLAEEYEQTLQDFGQITDVAEALLDGKIIVSNLDHLHEEIQKHRKFFVNLSHCRAILESLEDNLDNETRAKYASLHHSLHDRATTIIDRAAGRAQQMTLAASRWSVLDQGMKEELQWLRVAEQRIPDLTNVTSMDHEQYINLYQSISLDVSHHYAKMLRLLSITEGLQNLIVCPGLESECSVALETLLKLQENIDFWLIRLTDFKENWLTYDHLINRIEGWINLANREMEHITPENITTTSNLRRFWELKAQHEVHNNLKNECSIQFEKALEILPISDEMVQRQFFSKVEDKWRDLSNRINNIHTTAIQNISDRDVTSGEKLNILEDEIRELRGALEGLKGVIKSEDELNLYIERLQVMTRRIDRIQNELGRLSLLPTAESERLGALLSQSGILDDQIAEELERSMLLKEKIVQVQAGIARVQKGQRRARLALEECEAAERLGSDVVERATENCDKLLEDLAGQWKDILALRQALHTLPISLRICVSPTSIEKDISALQETHAELEAACNDLSVRLRNKLQLWRRFERQLELVQGAVREADYMVELLTVQGQVDYDRLLKATERLETLSESLSRRSGELVGELRHLAAPLAASAEQSVAAKLRRQLDDAAAAYEHTCANLTHLCDKYHKAVELWRRYREAAAAVRAFADTHEGALHALRPDDAPATAHRPVALQASTRADVCEASE
ncbi:unnamed protein product [Colias eurytheme]|nr:unnamed protein product [Colias eurytheme]